MMNKKYNPLASAALFCTLLSACGGSSDQISRSTTQPSSQSNSSTSTQTSDSAPESLAAQTTLNKGENGFLKNYPLEQKPVVGTAKVLSYLTAFDDAAVPKELKPKMRLIYNSFNKYVKIQSNGLMQLSKFKVSPTLNVSTERSFRDVLSSVKIDSLVEARRIGFDTKSNYKFFAFIRAGHEGFGGVGGEETYGDGYMVMGPQAWSAGGVHEMFHMFSLGHAEAIEGNDAIFPGENVGGLDPYFFMGSEEDQKNCPLGVKPCDIYAPLSLPHRARLGWIKNTEIAISKRDEKSHVFTIYNQDTFGRPKPALLGVYLTGYENEGVFVVSYIKKAKSHVITKNGVLVHYVPYQSPAVSRLLDLSPNSKTGNPVRPGEAAYDMLYDFGDAAIKKGDSVNVSNMFNIEVLNEGKNGKDDYWAKVKITPKGKAASKTGLRKDSFKHDSATSTAQSPSLNWDIDPQSEASLTLNDAPIYYPGLDSDGISIRLSINDGDAAFAMNRRLEKIYTPGDTMWLSYLISADKIGKGRILVGPTGSDALVGKTEGVNLAISNTQGQPPGIQLDNGVPTLVVAKYTLLGDSAKVSLWVNPALTDEPKEEDAHVNLEHANIVSIHSLSVQLGSEGGGIYSLDRIQVGDTFEEIVASEQ